jgi:hypothetical protein
MSNNSGWSARQCGRPNGPILLSTRTVVSGMLGGVTVRGVETVTLADIAVGDVVLFGSVGARRDVRAMRIDSVEEQPNLNDSWALRGPMIDLPVVGSYSFDGAPRSENHTVGSRTVTRLVPQEQVTAFLDGVAEQWGDDLHSVTSLPVTINSRRD